MNTELKHILLVADFRPLWEIDHPVAVLPVSVFPAGTVCVYHCEGSKNPPAATNRRGQMMSPVVICYFTI